MAADAAIAFLLEQVSTVVRVHPNLLSGADKELENVKDAAEELKAVLKDMGSEERIENEILETIHEVEDSIDSLLTQASSRGQRLSRRGRSDLSPVDRIVQGKEQVRIIIEKVKAMRSCAQGDISTLKQQDYYERRLDPQIWQDKVVGLKDEEEIIKSHLRTDQLELDVIPIIGMPGLGKTTLMWKIYNDEKIRYEFPIRIWVQFSQMYNSRDVLIQIMKHFTSQMDELHSMSYGELIQKVNTCLSRDRFLLVVDDVWKTEHWDEIKYALPLSNGNGKVMITSRELRVGRHVKEITKPHMQRPLNPDESWELLQLGVFGRLGDCPAALEGIGKVVAANCYGMPMILLMLGGVLKHMYLSSKSDSQAREKWIEVAKNEILENLYMTRDMVKVMPLIYDTLPDRLKDCFLYLGVFPANHEIPAWTLTRLWIAEGFIQPEEERTLEEIAEANLNDLIGRNMLTIHKMNPMQEVKVCRVYNGVREFCISKASEKHLFQDAKMLDQRTRRLYLHSDLEDFFSADLKGPCLRSFLCFQNEELELDPEYISAIPKNFPSLRILQSNPIKFNEFPQRVTKLNHLRYIVLCVPDLTFLPETLSQLWNLQTITVHTNSGTLTVRANLWKMMRLRHVKTKTVVVLDKTWEGEAGGENLQTINRLCPRSVPEVSRRAINLKTLGVHGKLDSLFEDMPLGNMNRLEKLKLYHDYTSENQLKLFPDSSHFPPNLKRLTLLNTFLDWKHMSTLAMIPSLEVLKLKDNAFSGISWVSESYTFRKLRYLFILYADLVIWTASHSTFPCLRHLELKNCENLNAVPDGILQCLETLDIGRVRKSIADSAKNMTIQLKLGADLI